MGSQGGHVSTGGRNPSGCGSVIRVRYKGRTLPVWWDGGPDLAGGLGSILREFGENVSSLASLGGGGQHQKPEAGVQDGWIETSVANTNPDNSRFVGIVFRRFGRRWRMTPVNVPSLLCLQGTMRSAGEGLEGTPLVDLEQV